MGLVNEGLREYCKYVLKDSQISGDTRCVGGCKSPLRMHPNTSWFDCYCEKVTNLQAVELNNNESALGPR